MSPLKITNGYVVDMFCSVLCMSKLRKTQGGKFVTICFGLCPNN